tara:strand:- start:115 stop:456 length:342 start_codon:yes stop_codon:yes gene_type:complete
MAVIQTLDVVRVPFQGEINFTDQFSNAYTQMKYPNDGYTVLYVRVGAVTPTITISSVQDSASRYGNVGPTVMQANKTVSYGPFRPIWWNNSGFVYVTLSNAANVTVAVLNYQF